MYDNLFAALAQAKSLPSKAFRTAESALEIPGEAVQGYTQGLQLKRLIQQPQAMARLLNATPGGHDIVETLGPEGAAAALAGMNPSDVLSYAGKQAQLQQQGNLGYAGIAERNTASQRAFDAATARTTALTGLGNARNLTTNIADHENAIKSLAADQDHLASQMPDGLGGTIQKLINSNQDVSQYLTSPKYGALTGQMKSNQGMINFHQAVLQPLYKAQGMIPPGLLDNSDLSGINPPSEPGNGGDTSNTGLPGLTF